MENSDRASAKRSNFVRLAERRTNAVLDKLRILGNCANRNAYDYSDEDVSAIFNAIDEELKTVRAKFASTTRREFTLSPQPLGPNGTGEVVESGTSTD
jgi:hypothetical protein